MQRRSPRRRLYGGALRGLMYGSAVITCALLLFLIGYIFWRGLGHISWKLLSTQSSYLTDIIGNELYAGNAESTITVAADYNAFLKPSGSFTWTNPLRRMADPRIILVDGLYYYVYTTGSVLSVYTAANTPDLAYSVGEPCGTRGRSVKPWRAETSTSGRPS